MTNYLQLPALFFVFTLTVSSQLSSAAPGVLEITANPDNATSNITDKRKGIIFSELGSSFSIEFPAGEYPAIKPEMVSLSSGTFRMGCGNETLCYDIEKPVHSVNVPAFELGKYEVTFDEWRPCFQQSVCRNLGDQGWGRGNRPVINVSWNDVQTYIAWLNQQTGDNYRLPSEAEWEYAARAGTRTSYSTGNCLTTDQANFNGMYPYKGGECSQIGPHLEKTVPVGSCGQLMGGV